jgi:hypothetical protein
VITERLKLVQDISAGGGVEWGGLRTFTNNVTPNASTVDASESRRILQRRAWDDPPRSVLASQTALHVIDVTDPAAPAHSFP